VRKNTLSTTPKGRATKAIYSIVLPAFKKFYAALPGSEIKDFGILVVYGTKDFSEKFGLTFQSEAVGVVAPSDACKRFVGGEITELELLNSGSVYLADREMTEGMKKITVPLE
jgi:hypothetical protein